MKLLFADSNHPILHETLQKNGFQCDLFWDKSANELKALLPNYDGLVIRSKFKITKELIDLCPHLKCIGRVGAGMENIDVAYATSKGINCVSAPEGNRDAVGEHTLGMLLMLLNNLKRADNEVRQGIWKRIENRGHEIAGKTIGIIGYGNMGSAFAQRLRGFDCKVLVFDKYKTHFANEFISDVSLETIQQEADIISIHTPLTEETTYYIDDAFISGCQKNIYIINAARGKCLNTADLVTHLQTGKVIGACLDVLEYETTSFENIANNDIPLALAYLLKAENVVLSPHIAGWTHESNYKMSVIIANKMSTVLRSSK